MIVSELFIVVMCLNSISHIQKKIMRLTLIVLIGVIFNLPSFAQYPYLKDAKQYYISYNQERGLAIINQEVEENPNSAEILLKSAKLKMLYGLNEEAENDLQLAKSLNPYALEMYGFYGPTKIINIMEYRPNEHIVELDINKRLSYYYTALEEALVQSQLSSIEIELLTNIINQVKEDNLEEAMKYAEDMIHLYPKCAMAYDLQGLILEKQGAYVQASKALNQAVTLQPGYALAWYNWSRVERKSEQYDLAKQYLDKAIQLKADLTKAYFDRAVLLKLLGEEEEAIKDLDNILQAEDKEYTEAYINRGLIRKMIGDFEGALTDLNEAIKYAPTDSNLLKNRGNLHLLLGYYEHAIFDYSEAIKLNRTKADIYFNRGLAHYLNGDEYLACSDFEESEILGLEKAQQKLIFLCN